MTECLWRRGLSKCIKTVFTRLKQKVPKFATFLTEIDGWLFFHRRVFIIEMFFYIDAIVNEACRAINVLLSAAVGLCSIVFSNIIFGFFFSYKL